MSFASLKLFGIHRFLCSPETFGFIYSSSRHGKKVIIGESRTFEGSEEFMKQQGVEVINLDNNECASMMQNFIEKNLDLWLEDIGK